MNTDNTNISSLSLASSTTTKTNSAPIQLIKNIQLLNYCFVENFLENKDLMSNYNLILLLKRYLVKLVSYSKSEFSVLELEKLGQKLLIPKDLVFCHSLNKLFNGQALYSLVELCDPKVYAD